MTRIVTTQKIEVTAYNMSREKESFIATILENNMESILIRKGVSKLVYDKRSKTLRNNRTGENMYTETRFF